MKTIGFLITLLVFGIGCQRSTSAGFDASQVARITAADAMTPMRVWKISSESDSLLLRQAAETIRFKKTDPVLDRFIDRLFATVRDSISLGVGIAAPQVGILKQIIWVQRFDKEELPFEVYINPTIVTYSVEKREGIEGCLSIPNRQETCLRSEWIEIAYNKQDG